FFIQAENGIRDYKVTGVQTCALPISSNTSASAAAGEKFTRNLLPTREEWIEKNKNSTKGHPMPRGNKSSYSTKQKRQAENISKEIGRASCRERGWKREGV